METNLDLIITANHASLTADFRLLDSTGSQVAYRQTDFKPVPVSRRQALFDLRDYLDMYVEPGGEEEAVARTGVLIAEKILGEEIFLRLWQPEHQRTLRIQLPGAADEDNHLAAALARVPWEIARPTVDTPSLAERNLLVRIVHHMREPATQPVPLARDEALRVLFVFAESRESNPLAARLERGELLWLFESEIDPDRLVAADFLTHGVTRERLQAQIADRGGYHVVHWSGHGHLDLLELARPGGAQDLLSGEELLDLFVESGGFIPRLFFLSACHSGDILRVKDWNDFFAVAEFAQRRQDAENAKKLRGKEISLESRPGYTGTAHALLQGGVGSVVAMRYAVGDDYARELAVEFYRALLAHSRAKSAAAALTMARRSLLDPGKHEVARFAACDHATPVLYGAEQPGLTLLPGRSPALDARDPRLHQIAELTTEGHEHFVGRTWELAGLGAEFIGDGPETKPVALITGLGGMGKTALAAEALSLWQARFQWVLLYQAKPNALGFEATLRDIHIRLYGELLRYHDHVREYPADAIHRPADSDFTGPERLERLSRNLVRALRDEPILLVLDNFETNLKPSSGAPGTLKRELQTASIERELQTGWACQDPAWDRCLALLADGLRGSPSRALITCRRPLAALAGAACHRVLLGPLPPGEAALYLHDHPGLSRMVFGGDPDERALAKRLLAASRFHPLLMDRLARLATGGPGLRSRLIQALDALESSRDYSRLPELFAGGVAQSPGGQNATELAYLRDALAASLDQLIADAGLEARRLLWIIALANDPVPLSLLQGVWGGESLGHEQLRLMKQMVKTPPKGGTTNAMPPELRAEIDALPDAQPRPDIAPLIAQLLAVGLATEDRAGPEDPDPEFSCHELVRERILSWMTQQHPGDPSESKTVGGLTENAIRLAYAERLEAIFRALLHENMTAALEAGSRALVYCVQAGAYDRLASFAGDLVTSTSDPRLLEGLLPHLQDAASSAPEGKPRWSCVCYLADALRNSGRPDASLPFYEQAAAQARAAAEAGGPDARQAWADVVWITGNWANALGDVGDLDASRQRRLESAEAKKEAGMPAVYVIGSELEALRIDIMQGRAAEALPEVEARLLRVEDWWRRSRAGETAPEAPDREYLARTIISALDIAREAHYAQNDWEPALRRIDAALEIKQELQRPEEDIALTRGNRANVLSRLGRFAEARAELEALLQVFRNDPARSAKVRSSLASLFNQQGDLAQAIAQQRRALTLREQLPDPSDRAISHNNLANYLDRINDPSALAESRRHQLAALVYRLVSGLGESLRTSLRNYTIRFRGAQAAGITLDVPRVAELLADPAFRPLADWLRQRQVNLDELQAAVDQLLDRARQAAMEQK
jgi:tetratricopeptide (TPR) repeat protein